MAVARWLEKEKGAVGECCDGKGDTPSLLVGMARRA
jgi:hypothetical protein